MRFQIPACFACILGLSEAHSFIRNVNSSEETSTLSRAPLTYASLPANTYTASKRNTTTTLLDLIKSRTELSELLGVIGEPAGALGRLVN
jgi:hypothetical protein